MKKMVLLIAMAALVCWIPGQALATTTTYTSTLNTTGTHDSSFDVLANYGTVTVTATDTTHATVAFALLESPKDFDFNLGYGTYSAFLNVSGTASVTNLSSYWNSGGTQSANGLGSFDVSAYNFYFGSVEGVTFTLTATNGTTWADAAHVLTANAAGFDAAAFVNEDSISGNPCGYVGECAAPSGVPIPPSVLLLGSGLLGLVGLGWRRKQS